MPAKIRSRLQGMNEWTHHWPGKKDGPRILARPRKGWNPARTVGERRCRHCEALLLATFTAPGFPSRTPILLERRSVPW
jgi:hypothetical protein